MKGAYGRDRVVPDPILGTPPSLPRRLSFVVPSEMGRVEGKGVWAHRRSTNTAADTGFYSVNIRKGALAKITKLP